MDNDIKPYIPPENHSVPEFTAQAIVLGIILSLIMCAANIYVGLKAGMTVSAAIPASVMSMGVLRGVLRRGTILENNVVHTVAGAGESLAAGIIFTVPALVLLGLWDNFNYLETTLIAMAGGVMGVAMMISLRKPMIIEQKELKFPEGVACAEVLKAGDRGGADMKGIFIALGFGALFKACIEIVGLFKSTVEVAFRGGRTAFYAGTDISPMLAAVGFIVGWEISLLIFLGGALSFAIAIPVLAIDVDFSGVDSLVDALAGRGGIYGKQVRFFGIGAMVVAGLFSIIKIAASMGAALRTVMQGLRGQRSGADVPRTEQDIRGIWLIGALLVAMLLSATVYYLMTGNAVTTVVTSVIMFVLAFFFVAVASYIVGLVGSSNSPVSGMTICTVLVTAGLLLAMGYTGEAGMLATLGVAGVVCCATCTSGDICQDLKIGQIVGATPRKLQSAEFIGAIAGALIIAPVMRLLHQAYGIGEPARAGVEALKAPQGAMFKELVSGLFGAGNIPWDLVGIGAAVGAAAILIDKLFLEPRQTRFRLYAMPLAVGMYLPWSVTFPILFGGAVYWYVERRSRQRGDSADTQQSNMHRGLLFSSGLVAGEAIMGVLLAPIIIAGFQIPWLTDWQKNDLIAPVSLVALLAVTGYIGYVSLSGPPAPPADENIPHDAGTHES